MEEGRLQKQFITRLESLRGLAAFGVALYHSVSIFEVQPSWYVFNKSIQLIGNGGGPVMVFFVLSGHVLTLSILSEMETGYSIKQYLAYLLRRAFRLMPLLTVAILVTYTIKLIISPSNYGLTDYAKVIFSPPKRLIELASNLSLKSASINPVAWTLEIEVVWSILLPLLVLVLKLSPVWNILALILFGGAAIFIPAGYSMHYALAFFLGASMINWIKPARTGLLALFGLTAIWVIPIVTDTALKDIVFMTAASLIVWATIHGEGSMRLLDWRPVRFLGKTSYSFYLWHFTILYIITAISPVQGFMGNMFVLLASLSITIPISALSHRYIEMPFVNVGRAMAKVVKTRQSAHPLQP